MPRICQKHIQKSCMEHNMQKNYYSDTSAFLRHFGELTSNQRPLAASNRALTQSGHWHCDVSRGLFGRRGSCIRRTHIETFSPDRNRIFRVCATQWLSGMLYGILRSCS